MFWYIIYIIYHISRFYINDSIDISIFRFYIFIDSRGVLTTDKIDILVQVYVQPLVLRDGRWLGYSNRSPIKTVFLGHKLFICGFVTLWKAPVKPHLDQPLIFITTPIFWSFNGKNILLEE